MAGFLHAQQAGDLALGKPPLRRFPKSASVGEALRALKKSYNNDLDLSLWEELCPVTEKPLKDLLNAHGGTGTISYRDDEILGLQGCKNDSLWRCVGKVCMVDIICFLARDESLANLGAALASPVASLVPDSAFSVHHVDSQTKLLDALGEVLDGVQNLVVPVDRNVSSLLTHHKLLKPGSGGIAQINLSKQEVNRDQRQSFLPQFSTNISTRYGSLDLRAQEYCWLTLEDIVRYLLSCIGLFSPLPMKTISSLGIIKSDVLTVDANADAIMALPLIQQAAKEMSAVAVVEQDGEDGEFRLVGEISAFTMKSCDETAALALATLSVQDFLSFTHDCGGPPHSLVNLVQSRLPLKLNDTNGCLWSNMDDSHFTCTSPVTGSMPRFLARVYSSDSGNESSDEDSSAVQKLAAGQFGSSKDPSAQMYRKISFSKGRSAPNTCRPWSSLVAVMVQALTHRVSYIWVTDDDNSLLGIVTYLDIISCILSHVYTSD